MAIDGDIFDVEDYIKHHKPTREAFERIMVNYNAYESQHEDVITVLGMLKETKCVLNKLDSEIKKIQSDGL